MCLWYNTKSWWIPYVSDAWCSLDKKLSHNNLMNEVRMMFLWWWRLTRSLNAEVLLGRFGYIKLNVYILGITVTCCHHHCIEEQRAWVSYCGDIHQHPALKCYGHPHNTSTSYTCPHNLIKMYTCPYNITDIKISYTFPHNTLKCHVHVHKTHKYPCPYNNNLADNLPLLLLNLTWNLLK